MSLARAQEEIGSREFGEWMAYNRISPIGDERADIMSALGTMAMVNSWGGKSKIEDFLPFDENEKKPQTTAEQMAIVEGAGRQWRQ